MVIQRISFSNSIKPRPLDRETKYPYLISLIGMIIYLFFSLITVVAIISFYVKSKNPKFLDYLLIFSIVTFIQVVYRWIFGPILYIQYRNYIDNKNWSYADKYLTFAIPYRCKINDKYSNIHSGFKRNLPSNKLAL